MLYCSNQGLWFTVNARLHCGRLAHSQSFDCGVLHLKPEMFKVPGFIEDTLAQLIEVIADLAGNADCYRDGIGSSGECPRRKVGLVSQLLSDSQNPFASFFADPAAVVYRPIDGPQ